MKKRSLPHMAAAGFMAAALIAAPLSPDVSLVGAQSEGDEMVDVYDPYDPDSGNSPLEEITPWEADEHTEEWNDDPTPEAPVKKPAAPSVEDGVQLQEETPQDDWTDLYKDIYDDPEGIYDDPYDEPLETDDPGWAEPADEPAEWEAEELPNDDEPLDAGDESVQPYD